MIKNIIKSILFCCGLVAILYQLSPVFYPSQHTTDTGFGDVLLRSIDYQKPNSLDVVVVGDSEAYAGIIPLQLWKNHGIASHTIAMPKQPLHSIVNKVERVLQHQQPKVIIYETHSLFTETTRVGDMVQRIQDVLPTLRYHNRWKESGPLEAPDLDVFLQGNVHKYTTVAQAADAKNYKKPTDKVVPIASINRFYFEKLVALCKEKGIRLVALTVPTTKNWSYARHNAVAELTKANDVTYLDLNLEDSVVIDWAKETYDKGDHLNYFGATKVTTFLGNYLAQLTIFENKRQHPDYHEWNEKLQTVSYMKNPPKQPK